VPPGARGAKKARSAPVLAPVWGVESIAPWKACPARHALDYPRDWYSFSYHSVHIPIQCSCVSPHSQLLHRPNTPPQNAGQRTPGPPSTPGHDLHLVHGARLRPPILPLPRPAATLSRHSGAAHARERT
jgi:hypothetical protein